ncbi:MAG: hypothetical protein J6B85_13735 [Lachnospiraceae bacterium]|nr:hypothetical protein [Lachnospiraceae bacterium]
MEIRKLEVDYDKQVLKINGQEFAEAPVIVTLPGPDGGRWKCSLIRSRQQETRKSVID